MKKTKKLVSLLLVIAMAVSMLTACGGKKTGGAYYTVNEDGTLRSKKTLNLECYSQLANYSGELTGWFAKILLDKFNVKISIIPDTDGIYETRMESGNLGDLVVWGSDGNDYKNAARKGYLLDWEEDDMLNEFAPYIAENMSSALYKNRHILDGDLTATDDAGNPKYSNPEDYTDTVYGFGHNVASSTEDHESFFYTWDLRWDLYKELGCPQMKDLNDLLEVFKQMQELRPTDQNGKKTYAMSLWPDWDGSMVMYVKAMVTAYYGYDELGIGNYDYDTGTFYDCLKQDGPYIEMLRWFNQLYREGLLDPDSMTQTYDEMAEKVKNGGVFFSIFNYAGSSAFNTDDNMENGEAMLSVVPDECSPICYGMDVAGGNRVWTIGAKTEYPEICLSIINWLCTPEGRVTSDYGPMGTMWYIDEEGYTHFTDLGRMVNADRTIILDDPKYKDMSDGYTGEFNSGACQINNTTWSTDAENPLSREGEKYNCKTWVKEAAEARFDIEKSWRDYYGVNSVEEFMEKTNYHCTVATPAYSESAKSAELSTTWKQVTECIVKNSWLCIYADDDAAFEAQLTKMINDANAYGYDKCLEWSQNEANIKTEMVKEIRERAK